MANGKPMQVEDRYVNPKLAPDYMDADFGKMTPNNHLMEVAPLSEVEHVIDAIMPTAQVQKLLEITNLEPCLQLSRRTWSNTWEGNQVVSTARLIYPGKDHSFGTRFTFNADKSGENRSA